MGKQVAVRTDRSQSPDTAGITVPDFLPLILASALACQPNYFRASFSFSLKSKSPAAPGHISSQPAHQRESSSYNKKTLSGHVPIAVFQGNHLVKKGGNIDPLNIRDSVPRSKRAESSSQTAVIQSLLSKSSLNTSVCPSLYLTLETQRWPKHSWPCPHGANILMGQAAIKTATGNLNFCPERRCALAGAHGHTHGLWEHLTQPCAGTPSSPP